MTDEEANQDLYLLIVLRRHSDWRRFDHDVLGVEEGKVKEDLRDRLKDLHGKLIRVNFERESDYDVVKLDAKEVSDISEFFDLFLYEEAK
jgi:hypothetical protein